MEITIKIDKDKFPFMFKLKDDEVNTFVSKIFKTGYDVFFPDKKQKNMNELSAKIDNINMPTMEKLNSLENALSKLVGNSSKKGRVGEIILEDIFVNNYQDIVYENKNYTPHSGDAWITLPDKQIIMIESKNYQTTVDKKEVDKLKNDMMTHDIKYAIMISFNSSIQGTKELDIYTFTHNGNTYTITMISNLSEDLNRLHFGYQITRKLMGIAEKKFTWVIKDINDSLTELNNIVNKNYLLRDNFINMENIIHKSLTEHYNILRDYQFEIENKMKEIISKINQNEVIAVSNILDIIKETTDKKTLSILSRIDDLCKVKKWSLEKIDGLITINKNLGKIGTIKIQAKKVIVNIEKNDIQYNFNINNEKQIKDNLKLLELI